MQRILLVDEDRSFAVALGKALAGQGSSLRWVKTPAEMMRDLAGSEYDNIVVDPGVSGCLWYGLLAELREAAPSSAVHVVTAFASSALSRRAADIEARSFFVKPTRAELVVATIVQRRHRWARLRCLPSLAVIEWEALNEALYHYQGHATLAARRLRIPRQTLYRKLRKYSPIGEEDSEELLGRDARDAPLSVVR